MNGRREDDKPKLGAPAKWVVSAALALFTWWITRPRAQKSQFTKSLKSGSGCAKGVPALRPARKVSRFSPLTSSPAKDEVWHALLTGCLIACILLHHAQSEHKKSSWMCGHTGCRSLLPDRMICSCAGAPATADTCSCACKQSTCMIGSPHVPATLEMPSHHGISA